jgi:hypothetical protein
VKLGKKRKLGGAKKCPMRHFQLLMQQFLHSDSANVAPREKILA